MSEQMEERMAARKAEFKKGIDQEDARRRRDDAQLSIRKNKREDKLAKRRQAPGPTTADSIGSSPAQTVSSAPADTKQMVAQLYTGKTYEEVLAATTYFRKLLSIEKNPPIQTVIDAGITPKLVELCQAVQYPKLQYEAAWALTNIASGTSSQTRVVIDSGAVPIFMRLMESQDEQVREQAIWAVGNIAGDGPEHRNMVLKMGAVAGVVKNLEYTKSISVLRNATWTLSNFARGKPGPAIEFLMPALPMMAKLIHSTDTEVLTDVCWAFSYFTDLSSDAVEAVVQVGATRRLAELVMHKNASIQTPALRTIGNMATGTDTQTTAVVESGVLQHLPTLANSGRKGVCKEVMWLISNITAGTRDQVEAVRQSGVMSEVIKALATASWEVKKEAAWAVSNYCSGGTPDQIRYLVARKVVAPLCELLTCSEPKIVTVVLEAIKNILAAGQPNASDKFSASSANSHADLIEECDGLDKIEALQMHQNTKIYTLAVSIIEEYFSEDEGENVQGLAPNMQSGSFAFEFGGQQPFSPAPAFNSAPLTAGFGGGGFGSPAQQSPGFGAGGFSFGAPTTNGAPQFSF